MLKKLIKYEMLSISRTAFPLMLVALAMSIISSILLTIQERLFSSHRLDSDIFVIPSAILGILQVMSFLVIYTSFFAVSIIILMRFYKNFFTDEGYLTFTLPVTANEQLIAKVVSGFAWEIIATLTLFAAISLNLLLNTALGNTIFSLEMLKMIKNLFQTFFREIYDIVGANIGFYIIELVVLILVSAVSNLLVFYLAITIGSISAKKHRLLRAIGAFFVIDTIRSIASSIIVQIFNLTITSVVKQFHITVHIYLLSAIVVSAAVGVAAFLLCRRMLTHKLNLD